MNSGAPSLCIQYRPYYSSAVSSMMTGIAVSERTDFCPDTRARRGRHETDTNQKTGSSIEANTDGINQTEKGIDSMYSIEGTLRDFAEGARKQG